ncbi:tetraacyldisaccharide 4'-kinase [Tateyamaria sp.]|uniref:tetraacyldisaccharide 4'-kinase n=1 Tax=Tateyamaria sp. TaxID=1929288 RepID=UPI00329D50F6
MRAPEFWQLSQPNWQATALRPLGAVYAKATERRLARGSRLRLNIPVVCVGEINAIGTFRRPALIAVVEHLRELDHEPHVVTRGYGGTLDGPVRVNLARHTAAQVGDETVPLAAFAEVWVAKDRAEGAQAAHDAGASVIVMDGGFQNPALAYDLSIVVVDAKKGFGNGLCLPAGPLREPLSVGLARADLLLSIGAPDVQDKFALTPLPPNLPQARATLESAQVVLSATTALQVRLKFAEENTLFKKLSQLRQPTNLS